ncbi:MAG: PAS domain S-box protein [Candidatus Omnitrophica bacterium]|nr:PAS domain S-box protein [Candidatus Omnitrophota bacterium]
MAKHAFSSCVLSGKDGLRVAAIMLGYFFAHHLAFLFPDSHHVLMAVWPAGGVGLASLLLSPRRLWPAIILALFAAGNVANILEHRLLINSLGFMTANVMESLGCAWLIIRLCGPVVRFDRVQEIWALLLAATVVNAFSACLGASVASLTSGSSFGTFWMSWWISDGLGILIVAPFIVTWSDVHRLSKGIRWMRLAESCIFMLLWGMGSWICFNQNGAHPSNFVFPYMLIVLLVWPAIRFGQRGVLSAIIVQGGILIISSQILTGPLLWGGSGLEERLLLMQMYLGFTAVSGMIFAASYSERRTAEEKLAESELRYRELVEGTDDLVTRVDSSGNLTYVNQAAEKIFGIKADACVGRAAFEFVHPEDRERTRKAFEDWVSRKVRRATHQNRLVGKSGRVFEMFWTVNLNFDTSGNVLSVGSIARDITEHKQAEDALRASEEKFRTLFNNSEVGMFRSRLDGSEFLDANSKYLAMLGWTREEVIGKPSVIVWGDPGEREKMVRALRAQGSVENFEFKACKKTGEERIFLTSLRLYAETGILEGSITDITERKKAEAALNKAKEDAEAANKAKTEFLLNISHDIRTPLNSILGLSSLLTSAEVDEKSRKCIQIIKAQGLGLLSLVEDILHISKLESGQMTLRVQGFDFAATMKHAVESARVGLGEKRVILTCAMPETIPRLNGDELRVAQILNNILSNAVKYTEQGEIRVTVTGALCGADRYGVEVSVKDTGFGIVAEDLPRIFDPFTRFHEFHGGKTHEGVGLGLNITKTLVHLMGGDIRVVSEFGKGSEFLFTLDFGLAH